MKTPIIIKKEQSGATLMEVLIALLVFSIGLQGIASLQYQAVKENFDSSQRSHGVWSAQELINRIRANPPGRAGGDYDFTGDPCAEGVPAAYCADRDGNNAAVCDEAQMATFDIWESMCATPNQALAQNQGRLLNLNLTIACADALACTEESTFTVDMQWQSKAVTDDAENIDDDDNALKTQQFQQVFQP